MVAFVPDGDDDDKVGQHVFSQKEAFACYLFACPLRICLWVQSSSLSTAANTIEVNVSKRL